MYKNKYNSGLEDIGKLQKRNFGKNQSVVK
jgi:hypothetical protein